MKRLGIAMATLVLAGCTSNSSHTLEIEGDPDAVARFVDAEKARPGGVEVRYQSGGQGAHFTVQTAEAQSEMVRRATAANLDVTETRSVDWSIGGASGSSTTTTVETGVEG